MLPPGAIARGWPTSQNGECAARPSELTRLPPRSQPAHAMDTRVQTGLVLDAALFRVLESCLRLG